MTQRVVENGTPDPGHQGLSVSSPADEGRRSREAQAATMATYEISTSGDLRPVTVPPHITWQRTTEATETVLVVTVGDTVALESALARLADLGFELESVRRAPAPGRPGRSTSRTSRSGPGTTYEVRVRGRVGPVLLNAVPHDHASYEAHHRTVVARATDDAGLVEVLATVLATGGQLESLRTGRDVTPGPSSR